MDHDQQARRHPPVQRRLGAALVAVACAGLLNGCAYLSRASESSSGVQGNAGSYQPDLSLDGHWMAFTSDASNLVQVDTNLTYDVFVRDNWTHAVTRISESTANVEGDLGSYDPAISDDGRVVTFTSFATNFVPGDANAAPDVFWHDRDADLDGIYDEAGATATLLVSARPDGASGDFFSARADLNADGSVVAFESLATNLLASPDHDTNDASDVYVATFDTTTAQRTSLRVVSRVPGTSVEANGESFFPSIDASGNNVAFLTSADNLLAPDNNNMTDIVVNNGAQLRRGTGAAAPNNNTFTPTLSRDGSRVAYISESTGLVPGDTVSNAEVFVTAYASTGVTKSAGPQAGTASSVSISGDGTRVAYATDDSQVVPGDTNGVSDVFVHDFSDGVTQRVSVDTALREGSFGGSDANLSGDGRVVAFTSGSSLLPSDTNNASDVFVRGARVPLIEWVSGFDPATSSNLSPVLRRGTHSYVRIHGSAFDYPVQVSLGQGVTVQSTSVGSQDVFVAVNVAPGAVLGGRDVIVNNQGASGTLAMDTFQLCHACITIVAP